MQLTQPPFLYIVMASILTEQDIRLFILDRNIADNPVDLDLSFSSEEIANAEKNAVRHFNMMPPVVGRAIGQIPEPLIHLYGTVYYLYLAKILNLSRNDVDYQAGGMSVDITKRRLANYTAISQQLRSEFEQAAKNYKRTINIHSYIGRIG